MTKTPYLMNSETREIFAYSEALATMKSPKFVPFVGKLPPPDFRRGVPVAPEFSVNTQNGGAALTEAQRIETIAGIVSLVPKAEISESGHPSLVVIEKLSGLDKVTRKEVNAATKMRIEALRGRNLVQKAGDAAEAAAAAADDDDEPEA